MPVSIDDVRHIAELARLGVSASDEPRLAAELSSILGHMDVLSRVETSGDGVDALTLDGMALRSDSGPPIVLARPINAFAPTVRDGFLIVPRLASHDSTSDE